MALKIANVFEAKQEHRFIEEMIIIKWKPINTVQTIRKFQ